MPDAYEYHHSQNFQALVEWLVGPGSLQAESLAASVLFCARSFQCQANVLHNFNLLV